MKFKVMMVMRGEAHLIPEPAERYTKALCGKIPTAKRSRGWYDCRENVSCKLCARAFYKIDPTWDLMARRKPA